MNLLYLSVHAGLEYYELPILRATGANVYSIGAYRLPRKSNTYFPGLDWDADPIFKKGYKRFEEETKDSPLKTIQQRLTPQFLDLFDTIVMMAYPPYLEHNLDVLKGRNVIVRMLGQSSQSMEQFLTRIRDQIKIVRYSPMESNIPNYAGEDALIRFGLDPDCFGPWQGNDSIITICQSIKKRGSVCNFEVFDRISAGFKRIAGGKENEEIDYGYDIPSGGVKNFLSSGGVYFNCNTKPASYTLSFIEAALTGIPIVSVGPKLGNGESEVFEVPTILENEFVSDNEEELRYFCQTLLNEKNVAKSIGEKNKQRAISLFNFQDKINEWKSIFQI